MIESVRRVAVNLLRGPRPESLDDIQTLKSKFGISRIVNLQSAYVEAIQAKTELFWCSVAGFPPNQALHLPWDLLLPPSQNDIKTALTTALAPLPPNASVYVHCREGVDRTGIFVSAYRILYEKWSLGLAFGEMIDAGFHLKPYEFWLHSVQEAIEALAAGPDPWQD